MCPMGCRGSLLVGAFVVGAALCGVGCNSQPSRQPFVGTVLDISPTRIAEQTFSDTIRFGRLHSGEVARLPLGIRNGFDTPMVVLRSETSCGCTTLEYESKPILPSDTLSVALLFDTSGQQGWLFKVVRVYFSALEQPLRLCVEAEVE